MRTFLDNIYRIGGMLSALFMFAIFTIVLLQVGANLTDFIASGLTGEAIGLVIPSYAEIAGFMLAGTSFLALPYALRHGTHIRVNLFIQRMGPRTQKAADVWSFLVGFILVSWLSFHAWTLVYESYDYGDLSQGSSLSLFGYRKPPLHWGLRFLAISLLDGFVSTLMKKSFFISDNNEEIGAE